MTTQSKFTPEQLAKLRAWCESMFRKPAPQQQAQQPAQGK